MKKVLFIGFVVGVIFLFYGAIEKPNTESKQIKELSSSELYYLWRNEQPRYIEECMWGKTPQ